MMPDRTCCPPVVIAVVFCELLSVDLARAQQANEASAATPIAGWVKDAANPVLGGDLGTCFDVSVLKVGDKYRMWFSWRPKKSIALTESTDGRHWTAPQIVLGPNANTNWEADINRPVVLLRDNTYHIWYTGFNDQGSSLGYATSPDGVVWTRMSEKPVLVANGGWEKACVMCPHVLWDDSVSLYKMWYSAGERHEPNAIGYATSGDGLSWTRKSGNPIFVPDRKLEWEQHKVTACQVIIPRPVGNDTFDRGNRIGERLNLGRERYKQRQGYLMFYIGFRNEHTAQIGMATSDDGISNWRRHPANPIVRPSQGQWDQDACYKPYAIQEDNRWMLWYNGRKGGMEQIGLVIHEGADLSD